MSWTAEVNRYRQWRIFQAPQEDAFQLRPRQTVGEHRLFTLNIFPTLASSFAIVYISLDARMRKKSERNSSSEQMFCDVFSLVSIRKKKLFFVFMLKANRRRPSSILCFFLYLWKRSLEMINKQRKGKSLRCHRQPISCRVHVAKVKPSHYHYQWLLLLINWIMSTTEIVAIVHCS